MRLWTLHPQYLDPQGLVALWRESLLARAVLRGKTKGYRNHPQLHRFLEQAAPRSAINSYLAGVLSEAESRGYSFDPTKVGPSRSRVSLVCTEGQLQYEWRHLLQKLQIRNRSHFRRLRKITYPQHHPLFKISPGPTEAWERITDHRRRNRVAQRRDSGVRR